jgi:polysaccharide chain length determinant protein (PEP-CTERM system associated)
MNTGTAAAGRTLADYGRIARRRWVYPVTIIPAALLIAIFLAFVLTPLYRSFGVIMIEASSISDRVVQSTVDEITGLSKEDKTIADRVNQQLDLVRRRVTSLDELKKLVRELDPYPDQPDLSVAEKAALIAANTDIERVDPIKLEPANASLAFSVYYDNPSPVLAQKIAAKLVDRFVTYNQRTRAEAAAQAYSFLVQQSKGVEATMREMEHKLAQFKAQYGDALPDAQARNIAGVDRVQRDLDAINEQIRTEEEKEATLSLQLSQTSPSLVAAVGDYRTEIAKLKSELAEAEQKYTPQHPDVKRLRRAVADLAAMGAAGDTFQNTKPDNPDYLLIRAQLSAVRSNLAALRTRAAQARAEQAHFDEQINRAPSVERQYTDLTRAYQVETARYTDLQQKIKAAALAQNFEGESRGERFTLIRSANMPTSPQFPNRLGIILIGFVLGGAIAFGAVALAEASDPSVRGADDVQSILETSPLGAVPPIRNREEVRRRRLVFGSVTAAYLTAAVVVVFTVIAAI